MWKIKYDKLEKVYYLYGQMMACVKARFYILNIERNFGVDYEAAIKNLDIQMQFIYGRVLANTIGKPQIPMPKEAIDGLHPKVKFELYKITAANSLTFAYEHFDMKMLEAIAGLSLVINDNKISDRIYESIAELNKMIRIIGPDEKLEIEFNASISKNMNKIKDLAREELEWTRSGNLNSIKKSTLRTDIQTTDQLSRIEAMIVKADKKQSIDKIEDGSLWLMAFSLAGLSLSYTMDIDVGIWLLPLMISTILIGAMAIYNTASFIVNILEGKDNRKLEKNS